MNIISNWNSNTVSNLNTVTNLLPVEFRIEYDEIGDISWYKDDIRTHIDNSVSSSTYTTNWLSYGMKTIKVQSTNINGTSQLTTFIVEVVETGTATITETEKINNVRSYTVNNGWSNIPSLYLFNKKTNWLEYIQEKIYLLKANVGIDGLTSSFKIDPDSINELRIQGLPHLIPNPPFTEKFPVNIWVLNKGSLDIKNVTIKGWNTTNNAEITLVDKSPKIQSEQTNNLNVSNSTLRHIYLHYNSDRVPANDIIPTNLIDNNTFDEGNPFNVNITNTKYIIISNNTFNNPHTLNLYTGGAYTYTIVENNKFYASPSATNDGNVVLGKGSKFIGNEVVYSGWNLVEIPKECFTRNNILHDSGGRHNGFNGSHNDRYFYNDYVYNIKNYSAFYIQLEDVVPIIFPYRIYIINARCTNAAGGISFFGGYDSYIYNYIANKSGASVQYGSDNIFFRKSQFLSTYESSGSAFRVVDYMPGTYGYVKNISLIDSIFTDLNGVDLFLYPRGSTAIVNAINSYRVTSLDTIRKPTTYYDVNQTTDTGAEIRFYVWVDIIVKNELGNPIQGAKISIQNLTDTKYPAINVSLPPPPPDLYEYPSIHLPRPSIGNFTEFITGSDGRTLLPNYGWSLNSESSIALLYSKQGLKGWSPDYQYLIVATYNKYEISTIVIPDITWYRQDPTVPSKTITITIDTSVLPESLNIISTDPSNNSNNIELSKNINIIYNKLIQQDIEYSNITVYDNNNVILDITTAISGNILTIYPSNSFLYNSIYTIFIPYKAIKDQLGNNVPGDYTFAFKTIRWSTKPPVGTQLDFTKSINSGLASFLVLNEGTGTTLTDLSGNNNNGILLNMASPSTFTSGWNLGRDGISPAVTFDGINDNIRIPASQSLNITSDFSISLWANSKTIVNTVLSIPGFFIGKWPESFGRVTLINSSNIVTDLNTTQLWSLNTWIHIVVTVSNIGNIRIYINNTSAGSGTYTPPMKSNFANYVFGLGARGAINFTGMLDDIRIWNRVLLSTEVTSLYNNPYEAFLDTEGLCPVPICNINIT